MTVRYTTNYQKGYVNKPRDLFGKGEVGGTKRVLIGEYTQDTADELTNGDLIYVGKLPAGSRVLGARLFSADLGASTGSCTVGYLANGVDLVDHAAFIPTTDLVSAVVMKEPDNTCDGIFKLFTVETTVVIAITATVGTPIAAKMTVMIEYVND
jgi:hypothetical protein